MSATERVLAPAKLTLSLAVVGRRPDGYHELAAEMVSVDLADELVIDPDGDGLEIRCAEWVDATALSSGPTNLVRRALSALGRRAGVSLRKRIPVGAGLGGGSADAGAVLRWAGCDDLSVAAGLGADVPFCVHGGRARVSGLGEQVDPLEFSPRSFVLLLVPLAVPTAAVYRAWDALPESGRVAGPDDGGNDLTGAALTVEPRLGHWRDALGEACGRTPVLAGSGSTWFVPGTLTALGLDRQTSLRCDGASGPLVAVRTVPADWAGDP